MQYMNAARRKTDGLLVGITISENKPAPESHERIILMAVTQEGGLSAAWEVVTMPVKEWGNRPLAGTYYATMLNGEIIDIRSDT